MNLQKIIRERASGKDISRFEQIAIVERFIFLKKSQTVKIVLNNRKMGSEVMLLAMAFDTAYEYFRNNINLV